MIIMGEKKILVVDDKEVNRDLYRDLLKRKGYDVHSAEDGRKAMSMLSREYGLVITDYDYPERDEFLESVVISYPTTPIIMITGHSATDKKVVEAKNRFRIKEVIQKPITPINRLFEAVERHYTTSP